MTTRILVADDDPAQRESIARWLAETGHSVDTAATGREALDHARRESYVAYFVDVKPPGAIDAVDVLREIQKIRPDAAVVILSAYASVDRAVAAMRAGAFDYIAKPCNPTEISALVGRIEMARSAARVATASPRDEVEDRAFEGMVSRSPTMHEIFDLIPGVAHLSGAVLLLGETGTEKERLAKAIHACSDRRSAPFVAVACNALAETLFEADLLGQAGARSPATSARPRGRIESAQGGTLFLDGVDRLAPRMQRELLRVLDAGQARRCGSTEPFEIDARVVAASSADLQAAAASGVFRTDLQYRLGAITIRVPPLRERRGDIDLLVRRTVERTCASDAHTVADVSDGAMRILQEYDWPGNVRELEEVVRTAVRRSQSGTVTGEDVAYLERRAAERAGWAPPPEMTLKQVEKRVIEAALVRTTGNVKAAARSLGIDRSTLYDKIKRYHIRRPAPGRK